MSDSAVKKRVWGWMMFDWASQPYHTLLVTFIFAPYFANFVVGDPVKGQAVWGAAVGWASLCIAILAPILGALSDTTGRRRPWILLFSLMYVGGSYTLWYAVPGMSDYQVILWAFAIGLIGVEFATIFTNSYLPDLGPKEDVGKLSGNGWALGYVGGLIALLIMLALLAEGPNGKTMVGMDPLFGLDAAAREGTRSVGPLTAIWYAIFIIPFFLYVKDSPPRNPVKGAVAKTFSELWTTLKSLPSRKSLSAYLLGSMFYRDALNGVYTFGGIYATGALGLSIIDVGVFGIVGITSGAIFAWLGGKADKRFGPKPVIVVSILALIAAVLILVMVDKNTVFGMDVGDASPLPKLIFYICGFIIGAAGGTVQAASRTMLVRQADPARMAEAFGLYALSGKATSFLAPFSVAIATTYFSSQSMGILPILGLFVIGLILLRWVTPDGHDAG